MGICVKVARTKREIDDTTWVRHQVFVVEDGKFAGQSFPNGRMTDHYDTMPGIYNLIAYDGAEPVATIRLSQDSSLGLPAEEYFDFKPYRQTVWRDYVERCFDPSRAEELAEPVFVSGSMLSVRARWRNRRDVIRAIYRLSAAIAQAIFHATHIIAVVRHSTVGMYRRLGFHPIDDHFWNSAIGEHVIPLAAPATAFYRWAFGGGIDTPLNGFTDRFERLYVKAGETIYSEGDGASHAYIIAAGDIRITRRREDSAELTLCHLMAGELFGESALVHDKPRATTAVAITNAELISLSRDAIQREAEEKPERLQMLLRAANDRLRKLEDLFAALVSSPDSERLEHALDLARFRTVADPSIPEHRTFFGGPAELASTAAVDEETARLFLDEARDKGALTYSQKLIRFLR